MLTVSNITKKYKNETEELTVLKDVNFAVQNGNFFTIIGPSGCGKSTLLRIIAGLAKSDTGNIHWSEDPKLSFVFQNFALFPYFTAVENIEFGLRMQGVDRQKREQIVKELIEEVGLSGFEDKHPKELSGGMKQRVGIARALATNPNVLLLDEPFSSLDEFTAEVLRKLLLDLWYKRKITVVMVTHLIREALELSDRIAVMTPQPGSIEEIVDDSLERPRNMRTEGFFKMEDKLKKLIKF